MKPFILIVTYRLKENLLTAAEAFLAELAECGLPEQIRAEDGCLSYEYAVPDPFDGRLLLIERWENEEKQKAHLARPHMAALRRIKDAYVADTAVEALSAIGSAVDSAIDTAAE